jgi:indolepyruvate ferredoxin oxidoreductase alpha subunit
MTSTLELQELLLGDEAVALAAVHAGISGAFAYPGTPSTEIFE